MDTIHACHDCISNGDGVILCKGSSLKFLTVRPDRKERMENFNFVANNMIGKPFGTAFKVNGKNLVEIDPKSVDNHNEDDEEVKEEKDNREIIDNCTAQKMSRDDIMKLKEDGKDGEEIVGKIMDNSKTFKDKNVYSKAKYVKKKKKKHLAHFITRKPSARLLCQLFFKKAASKTLEIRPDTLAQMLTWSNVNTSSKVLLVETCQGLLLGSLLERLGSDGQIVQGYPGNFPVRIILNQFNFSEKVKSDLICGFSLEHLDRIGQVCEGACKENNEELGKASDDKENSVSKEQFLNIDNQNENMEVEEKDEMKAEEGNVLCAEDSIVEDDEGLKKEDNNVQHEVNCEQKEDGSRQNGEDNLQRDGNIPCSAFYTKDKQKIEEKRALVYLKNKLDSLIIASKFHPKELLIELINFIRPSSPIIIYCQYREPLMECYEYLRDNSLAVNVVVTETWFRNLQVLPNRTHPEITMSARSGYLLRGIKVKTDDAVRVPEYEPSKKKLKNE